MFIRHWPLFLAGELSSSAAELLHSIRLAALFGWPLTLVISHPEAQYSCHLRTWFVQGAVQNPDGDTRQPFYVMGVLRIISTSSCFCHFKEHRSINWTNHLIVSDKPFLFVFGGRSEKDAVLGDAHFLCLENKHWTEVWSTFLTLEPNVQEHVSWIFAGNCSV